jgi:hypothetical protein
LGILNIEEKLAQFAHEFGRSAEYVLQKNAKLYRRLSSCGVLHHTFSLTLQ